MNININININMNMNKLLLFNTNTIKTYSFTNTQSINLEIEYNRYIIFNELIKKIENILIIQHNNIKHNNHTYANYTTKHKSDNYTTKHKSDNININNINHKIYENKNILDRFVLECINYGITSEACDVLSDDNNILQSHIYNDDDENNIFRTYLFFNKCLYNVEALRNSIFFKKMILEYNEKHFKLTSTTITQLENLFINAQLQFTLLNNKTYSTYNTFNSNSNGNSNSNSNGNGNGNSNPVINANPLSTQNLPCSINHDIHNNYIIKYKKYTKTLSFNRYSKLINNYNRPFPYDIILMLLRNSLFDSSNQQWSIGINLYDNISILFDISFEMFASPLNFNMNMFCSLFLDTDKTFGSFGSFYNLTYDKLLNQNIKGVFYNPPYLPILMKNTSKICLKLLSKMDETNIDFTIVSFLPNWSDAIYIKEFIQSPYLIDCKVIKKNNYVLQEKDKGKLITGTFDLLFIILNSKKLQWNTERIQTMNTHINDIVLLMKQETYEQTYT